MNDAALGNDTALPETPREIFTFFWKGPFSQWHQSSFVIDGVRYVTAEQYMMAEKARLFGDDDTLRKIMATSSPEEQKALGRQVRGFSEPVWNDKAVDIVFRGNLGKFSQNRDLGELLRQTAGTTLVEASPYDRLWGIGLAARDKRAQSRATWRGKNLLGEILTAVRIELFGA